jgi:SulP family sulfate permease
VEGPGGVARVKRAVRRETLKDDATAGLLLGIESVPDGLASGLLAGVNPVAGVYAYLFGTIGGATLTSTPFMAVQATGAMSLLVADVDFASRDDPAKALFTLSIVTGVVMVIAGLLRLGKLLRFVPSSVMVGFISAVGVNIILGQLDNFTGYDASGSNRVVRAVDLLLHPNQMHIATLMVGIVTVVLIVSLQHTRLGALGMVVAIAGGSVLAGLFNAFDGGIFIVQDLADLPNGLPAPTMPAMADLVFVLIPAISLAFVGLVQGAGISAGFPNADGSPTDASRDFIGQGAGNLVSGVFQGMPVGGSMSASSLVVAGGARTRVALFIAGAVMAVVLIAFAGLVSYVAMPALAGLLMVIGYGTIKPAKIRSVMKTGRLQTTVMAITFILTMLIPLQYAVLVGVALAVVLHVVEQSNSLLIRRVVFEDGGRIRETDPPASIGDGEVVVLQPYGSLFFASAPVFEAQLPLIDEDTNGSVVIVRLRGVDQLGLSTIEVLRRYAGRLATANSKLKIVISSPHVLEQIELAGASTEITESDVYVGTEWLGETVKRANDDGLLWVAQRLEVMDEEEEEEEE